MAANSALPALNLISELIPPGHHNRPGTKIRPVYVTIHNTDNSSRGANAHAHSKFIRETGYYLLNGEKHWVSWHFTVDDNIAIQHVPVDEKAFHAGPGNSVSVAIEICMNEGIDQAAANKQAADLTAGLLKDLGLGSDRIRPHQAWTGKDCPVLLLDHASEGEKWREFLSLVEAALKALPVSHGPFVVGQSELDSIRELPSREGEESIESDSEEIDHQGVARQIRQIGLEQAKQYVAGLELPSQGREGFEGAASTDFLAQGKDQAVIVGSEITSFVRGVTPEQRLDIINSTLLAQLVAKKRVPDASDVYRWYNEYFEVLSNIGWVIQDRQFATYSEVSEGFEAHQAIVDVAKVLLGSNVAALAVVQSALASLKSMSENSPWITIFDRESKSARTARFQVTVAEQAQEGQFLVSLLAFGLEAQSEITQVLFFKFTANNAELKHLSGKVTIDSGVLAGVREAVTQKVLAFSNDYIKALPDLTP
jgi:hypothetical protein